MTLTAPASLTELDQWVLWLYERRGDTKTKVPQQTNGKRADSTDPLTWTDFDTAVAKWQAFPKHYAGVGFVFHVDDPFCGVDLDNCLDESGDVRSWAQSLVERFGDTYMEVSPSGRGIKMWARGKLPQNLGKVAIDDGGIEMYDRFRFFTVTGRAFKGAPLEVEDHAADILTIFEKLRNGKPHQQEVPSDGRIEHGKQHLTLVSLAGTMWRRGMCLESIEAALQEVNKRQCEQPGPAANISRLVRSMHGWRRPVA